MNSTHRSRHASRCSLLLATTALLLACDSGNNVEPGPAASTPVQIRFVAKAGDAAFDCDTPAAAMGAGQDKALQLRDLRLYIGNIRLVKASGAEARITLTSNAWQMSQGGDSVALLDFVDQSSRCDGSSRTTRTIIYGTAPAGAYSKIRFELGVPEALNHTSLGAAAPLNVADMFRNQQDGRWFARIESDYNDGGIVSQVFAPASAGCVASGDPAATVCTQPYRPTITLSGFDRSNDDIVVDYKRLLSETDLTASFSCTPGTSALCQTITARAGSDSAGQNNGSQQLFRVE